MSYLLVDCSVHFVVKSISVYVEWYLVIMVCHEDIHSQNNFYGLKGFFNSWCSTNHYLIRSVRQWYKQMCPFRPHEPIGVDITKEIVNFCMLHGDSCTRMTEMCFLHGLSPVGVSQYPIQLVSWIVHLHLRRLMVNPFACWQDKSMYVLPMCCQRFLCYQITIKQCDAHSETPNSSRIPISNM